MKKIKISDYLLHEVLSTVMLSPSIVKHLKGGKVYAYASWWDMDITQTEVFKRRKVLRLIRNFKRNYKLVVFDNLSYYVKK